MKRYHFKITCADSVLNGTNVSATASSESNARTQVIASIKNAARDMGLDSLELLGTGKMTAAQLMGAAGGKKSKRTIAPEQQRKMQDARRGGGFGND